MLRKPPLQSDLLITEPRLRLSASLTVGGGLGRRINTRCEEQTAAETGFLISGGGWKAHRESVFIYLIFKEESVSSFPQKCTSFGTAVVLGSGHVSHVHVYSPTTTVNRPHLLRGSSREEEVEKEESSALPDDFQGGREMQHAKRERERDAARGTRRAHHACRFWEARARFRIQTVSMHFIVPARKSNRCTISFRLFFTP